MNPPAQRQSRDWLWEGLFSTPGPCERLGLPAAQRRWNNNNICVSSYAGLLMSGGPPLIFGPLPIWPGCSWRGGSFPMHAGEQAQLTLSLAGPSRQTPGRGLGSPGLALHPPESALEWCGAAQTSLLPRERQAVPSDNPHPTGRLPAPFLGSDLACL